MNSLRKRRLWLLEEAQVAALELHDVVCDRAAVLGAVLLDPRVLQRLRGCHARVIVAIQQVGNKVLGRIGNPLPLSSAVGHLRETVKHSEMT